jgi:carbon starvation protein
MPEQVVFVVGFGFVFLFLGYLIYGRFLGRRVFQLKGDAPTPAHTMYDGVDYCPAPTPVLFGHHFASIAGLGPILGPALAVIWGWAPAVIWVLVGAVLIGAVHDLGALVVSLRHRGRSVGEVAYYVLGRRARLLTLLIIFFLMSLAMGAFCNTLADLFLNFNPDAIVPSVGLMIVAVFLGIAIYHFKAPLALATVVALLIFAGLIYFGEKTPILSYQWLCSRETQMAISQAKDATSPDGQAVFARPYGAKSAIDYFRAIGRDDIVKELGAIDQPKTVLARANYAWIGVLLLYGFLASILPVWLLLQPRDYINSFQLYFALITLFLGLVIATVVGSETARIDAPAIRTQVPGSPPMIPLLFVTIACGAVSGFHSLVSSGTTVKQLNREKDAVLIGYGAMLVEGALALLVIAACTAGLSAVDWGKDGVYSSWSAMRGLAAQLNAVVRGSANILSHVGIPVPIGQTFIAVTVTAFALTTLDSATRLLRFNVEELCHALHLRFLANRWFGSLLAVAGIGFFALVPAGKALWTLFGTTNQLLAGLSLLIVSTYLYQKRRVVAFTLIPMIFMLIMTTAAMAFNLIKFYREGQTSLWVTTVIVLIMAGWLVIEGILAFLRGPEKPDQHPDQVPEQAGAPMTASR